MLLMSVAYPAACSFCGLAHHEGYFPKRTQVAAHAKRIRELEAELERRTIALQQAASDNLHAYERERPRAEKLQAYNVDLKDRLETGSRWLKAEIAGRKKAEKDRDDWRRKFDALVAVADVPEGTFVPFIQELS